MNIDNGIFKVLKTLFKLHFMKYLIPLNCKNLFVLGPLLRMWNINGLLLLLLPLLLLQLLLWKMQTKTPGRYRRIPHSECKYLKKLINI